MPEITLPHIFDDPEGWLSEAVARGLDVALEETVTAIKTDPTMPVDRGFLRGGMTTQPARITRGGQIVGAIISSGVGNKYADVQDIGRRPGARNPPTAAITAWVRRARADAVEELAQGLQSLYTAAHPRAGKKARGITMFRAQAIFLLARGVVRKLKARGMEGRRFAIGQFTGPDGGPALQRVRQRVTEFIALAVRERGGGS